METHKPFSIRLSEAVLKQMRELANEQTRSLNGEILVVLPEYIQRQQQGLKPFPVKGVVVSRYPSFV